MVSCVVCGTRSAGIYCSDLCKSKEQHRRRKTGEWIEDDRASIPSLAKIADQFVAGERDPAIVAKRINKKRLYTQNLLSRYPVDWNRILDERGYTGPRTWIPKGERTRLRVKREWDSMSHVPPHNRAKEIAYRLGLSYRHTRAIIRSFDK